MILIQVKITNNVSNLSARDEQLEYYEKEDRNQSSQTSVHRPKQHPEGSHCLLYSTKILNCGSFPTPKSEIYIGLRLITYTKVRQLKLKSL